MNAPYANSAAAEPRTTARTEQSNALGLEDHVDIATIEGTRAAGAG